MIFKELDTFRSRDKFELAGRRAEEQMAHYLRRFFGSSSDVDVLNYLRIELGGEVAQMDHLVLHPFGLMIVESKSVAGSVQIKDDGQWIRWFSKQAQGMRSPITQARMQLMLLKELLGRAVKQKGFFDDVQMDVLVAISDSGTIQWPSSGALPEVCKADQVPERVLERVDQYRRLKNTSDVLIPQRRQVIGEFLCKVHKPLAATEREQQNDTPAPVVSEPVPQQELAAPKQQAVLPEKICKHCGGERVEIRHGQYGYFLACGTCAKNTAIRFQCPRCGGEGRVRKQGRQFFAECESCDASALYHMN